MRASVDYGEAVTDGFKIGELATAADVPTSTLRYYERVGLLNPSHRTEGNYRVYGPKALERVRFIRAAQAAGFSLDNIRALLELRDGERAACPAIEALIDNRLTDVETRLGELSDAKRHLEQLRNLCGNSSERDTCRALERLTAESSRS